MLWLPATATLGSQSQHATRGLPGRGSFIAIPLLMCAFRDCAHSCSECDAEGVFCATPSPTAARSRGTALPGRPHAHGRWSAFADSLHKSPPKSHRRHNVDRQLCIRGHMTCSHAYAQQRPSRCARCSIISALVGVLALLLRAGLLAVCRKVRWTACHAIRGQGVSLGDGRAIPPTLRFRRQTGPAAFGCRDADGAAHQR